MDSDTNIPNRPGQEFEIIAWTENRKKNLGKSYHCRSQKIRVDRTIYSPEEKAKLEKGIGWEIIQTMPPPLPENFRTEWHLVRRARFAMYGFPETDDVWPAILRIILRDFPRGSHPLTLVRPIKY
jgi:hypothetical protein